MPHHWRGTAFAPGATAADFERLMKDFNGYPKFFAPQVCGRRCWPGMAIVTGRDAGAAKHGLTVVMDTAYDITFARSMRGWVEHLAEHADR